MSRIDANTQEQQRADSEMKQSPARLESEREQSMSFVAMI